MEIVHSIDTPKTLYCHSVRVRDWNWFKFVFGYQWTNEILPSTDCTVNTDTPCPSEVEPVLLEYGIRIMELTCQIWDDVTQLWSSDNCQVCCLSKGTYHDDVIKWKHFTRYWPSCEALMFSLICAWTNGWETIETPVILLCHHCNVLRNFVVGLLNTLYLS